MNEHEIYPTEYTRRKNTQRKANRKISVKDALFKGLCKKKNSTEKKRNSTQKETYCIVLKTFM